MAFDLEQLQEGFFDEAQDALDAMEATLLQLGIGDPEPERVNTVFRIAHSLKGSSATFGLDDVASFTHSVEALLDELRGRRMQVTRELSDLLLKSVDLLREMLRARQRGVPSDAQRVADLQFDLEVTILRKDPASASHSSGPANATLQASGFVQVSGNPPDMPASLQSGPDTGSMRVSTAKLDEITRMITALEATQSMLSELCRGLKGTTAARLRTGMVQLEHDVQRLQESVMRVRMLPISVVFNRLPRMVRDLGRRLGKDIELTFSGASTELDKAVLEKLGDALVQLVRNCIDHGIESPAVRRAAGKPAVGTVHLAARHEDGELIVTVRDDGAGLDRDRILQKARAQGLTGQCQDLDDAAVWGLIFAAGFSTVERPTEVSGRGVGMDVVRRNVQGLGGSVEVSTQHGQGCCFTITLPSIAGELRSATDRPGARRTALA
jgi:two-component system, chemotaxis family, sensor kinase CheA